MPGGLIDLRHITATAPAPAPAPARVAWRESGPFVVSNRDKAMVAFLRRRLAAGLPLTELQAAELERYRDLVLVEDAAPVRPAAAAPAPASGGKRKRGGDNDGKQQAARAAKPAASAAAAPLGERLGMSLDALCAASSAGASARSAGGGGGSGGGGGRPVQHKKRAKLR